MPTVVLMKSKTLFRQGSANYCASDALKHAKVSVADRSPPSIWIWLHAHVAGRGSCLCRYVSGIFFAGYVAQIFAAIVKPVSVDVIRNVRPHTISHCEEDSVLFGVRPKKTAAPISGVIDRRKGWLASILCIPYAATMGRRLFPIFEHVRCSFFPKEFPILKVCNKVFREIYSFAPRHFDIQSLVCPCSIRRIRS